MSAMSRGREANTVHVVTGPSPRAGQPDLAQAQPEAVLADILDRTESARTATEAMREAQAFATDTGHLLAMYSAATRPGVYAAIDERLKARLSPAEYARYEAESQRPVFQRQVYAATLAGADLDEVLDVAATAKSFTGARSIAAVMHGRLQTARPGETEHRQAVPWAQRVPEVVRPENRAPGRGAGPGHRHRGGRAGPCQAERPEPWVLNTLGAYPVDGSPALQADWLARAGTAAGYRQAAGITDPNMVVGPAPQAHPELLTWHGGAVRALEIPTEERMIWSMTRGQLEATKAAGRMRATAPPEVSPQLRAERLAEADARARAAELAALGDHQAAQEAQARADAADVRATVHEGQAEVYTRWETSTAADRRSAELAKAELERRATAEQDARAQAETAAAKAETPDLPDPTGTTPDLVEPYAAADHGPGIEDPDAAAEALVAGMDQVELPEPDTTFPIEDPELAAQAEEMANRAQFRQTEAEARQQRVAEAQADRAQRAAMRERALRDMDMEVHSPEAWVSGPRSPSWAGPEASTPETAPEAEAAL